MLVVKFVETVMFLIICSKAEKQAINIFTLSQLFQELMEAFAKLVF